MVIEPATQVSEAITAIALEAHASVVGHRGGEGFLDDLLGDKAIDDVLNDFVDRGELFVDNATEPKILLLLSNHVVKAVYVRPEDRRMGRARTALQQLLDSPNPPRDAFALPGDRATKSLYESLGWKARLLTMRGD